MGFVVKGGGDGAGVCFGGAGAGTAVGLGAGIAGGAEARTMSACWELTPP